MDMKEGNLEEQIKNGTEKKKNQISRLDSNSPDLFLCLQLLP